MRRYGSATITLTPDDPLARRCRDVVARYVALRERSRVRRHRVSDRVEIAAGGYRNGLLFVGPRRFEGGDLFCGIDGTVRFRVWNEALTIAPVASVVGATSGLGAFAAFGSTAAAKLVGFGVFLVLQGALTRYRGDIGADLVAMLDATDALVSRDTASS